MLNRLMLLLAAPLVLAGCNSVPLSNRNASNRFIGLAKFDDFARSRDSRGNITFLSPEIGAKIFWNQLVVSWNAAAPTGTFVKVEAAAIGDGYRTKFYTLGEWSPDGKIFPRTSLPKQKDADGTVATDTLVLNHPATAAQIRITLGGTNDVLPKLKFLGLSFANTLGVPALSHPNTVRKIASADAVPPSFIAVPERSQHGYPHASGWCSPAALSMVLGYWAEVLHRPELNLSVPQVANAVYDQAYAGTGNWPFNTAFAGSFPGMRAYVTRFDDLSEVEDWVAAGIPVILSARWDWLRPGRPADADGHLVVVIGFTENGDVMANDPSAHPERGKSVRQTYRRADVVHAWTKSHHTVYLIHPVGVKTPPNRRDQWEN